jgi:hypothetical protein
MNMKVRPHGTTTAAHMSANEQQVAEFPVVGYTRLTEGGPIVMFGLLFVSDDLKHDYHQVFAKSHAEDLVLVFQCLLVLLLLLLLLLQTP